MNIFKIHSSPLFIRIVFVIAIFMMLLVSALTYRHVESINVSSDSVEHTYKVSIEIEDLFSNIKDLEIERRNFLLTKNEKLPQLIIASKAKIFLNIRQIAKLTGDNIEQKKLNEEVQILLSEKFKIVDDALINYDTFTTNEIKENLLEGRRVMDRISIVIEKMLKIEHDLLLKRDITNNSLTSTTPKIIFITLFTTIAIISLAFVKINRDLDEMKVSKELLELANESNNLAEIVGEYGTWFLNLGSNKYTFSQNEFRLLGVEPNAFEASLEEFMKYIHPEDKQYVQDIATNMVTLDILVPFTYRIIREDGQVRYLRGNGKSVINKSGEKILIGTTTDVTVQVEAQKLVEDRNRELETSNKELQAFNYVASHDLQEPLRKIQTFISRLIDRDLQSISPNGQQYLLKIQDSTERMRSLIDDLLQFSRTNKSEKVFENANFNELLENSKQDLAQVIETKKATITNEKLPVTFAIPFQIQQLFTNLINNSLKYSKAATTPEIKITSKIVDAIDENLLPKTDKTKYYKITFKDNGIGFDNEYAEKIFVLFNRLHNKDEFTGTGIGLSICKKIVENHKGYIFADGELNVGATFTIFIPLNTTNYA
jgi:signal transduction histidine kinase